MYIHMRVCTERKLMQFFLKEANRINTKQRIIGIKQAEGEPKATDTSERFIVFEFREMEPMSALFR